MFFVLTENDIKQNQNIRQVSYRNEARQELEEKLLIKPKNYQLLELFNKPWYTDSVRKHKLGSFYRATMNKKSGVICRVITFERMTSYILEDYFSEIGRLKKIKMKNYIVPVEGYSIKDEATMMIF